jgi:hypothetical protein
MNKLNNQNNLIESEAAVAKTVVMSTGEELVAVQGEIFLLGDVDIDSDNNVGYICTDSESTDDC